MIFACPGVWAGSANIKIVKSTGIRDFQWCLGFGHWRLPLPKRNAKGKKRDRQACPGRSVLHARGSGESRTEQKGERNTSLDDGTCDCPVTVLILSTRRRGTKPGTFARGRQRARLSHIRRSRARCSAILFQAASTLAGIMLCARYILILGHIIAPERSAGILQPCWSKCPAVAKCHVHRVGRQEGASPHVS